MNESRVGGGDGGNFSIVKMLERAANTNTGGPNMSMLLDKDISLIQPEEGNEVDEFERSRLL